MKYSFKLLDICNFIKGSLSKLSQKLSDEYKIVTRNHFPDNFELLKEKAYFLKILLMMMMENQLYQVAMFVVCIPML